jgi:hypothetical protein
MSQLIKTLKEFNISNSLMKRVNEVLETKENKPLLETLSKAEKKKKKKRVKQRLNNQLKKNAIDGLKEHQLFMESLGWYKST